jgi:hypothetical protein
VHAYPPAPWRLSGELTLIPALVRGRSPGGLMLVNYRAGTLTYNELIVFSGWTWRGFVVSHIYVDSEASLWGGREIWGLPKQLAEFAPGEVRQDGRLLLRARLRKGPGPVPLPLPAWVAGAGGISSLSLLRLLARPALARIESPFLSGTRLGLNGDFDLTMRPPFLGSRRAP